MLNVKKKAFTEIEKYIHLYDSSLSRYEIDKNLLNRGYEPAWIEETWQNRAEKHKRLARHKRIEHRIILVNIILLIWFFKPSLPMFILFAEKNTFNQLTLIPPILVLLVALIFWYWSHRSNKPFVTQNYLMTIAPLVFIVLLPVFDFLSHYHSYPNDQTSLVAANEITDPSLERWKTENPAYRYYSYYSEHRHYRVVYSCDNFGLLCFEEHRETIECCG